MQEPQEVVAVSVLVKEATGFLGGGGDPYIDLDSLFNRLDNNPRVNDWHHQMEPFSHVTISPRPVADPDTVAEVVMTFSGRDVTIEAAREAVKDINGSLTRAKVFDKPKVEIASVPRGGAGWRVERNGESVNLETDTPQFR